MKIIGTDNFDRDTVSDFLVCENVSEHHGRIIVELLNDRLCCFPDAPTFYKLVPDDYKLRTWEP